MTDSAVAIHPPLSYAGGSCKDDVIESFLASCTSLQQLIPEMKATWTHAMDTRIKLSTKLAEGKLDKEKEARAKAMVGKLEKKLGSTDAAPVLEDAVLKMLADYEKVGKDGCKDTVKRMMAESKKIGKEDMQARYEVALAKNDEYIALDTEATQVLRFVSCNVKPTPSKHRDSTSSKNKEQKPCKHKESTSYTDNPKTSKLLEPLLGGLATVLCVLT